MDSGMSTRKELRMKKMAVMVAMLVAMSARGADRPRIDVPVGPWKSVEADEPKTNGTSWGQNSGSWSQAAMTGTYNSVVSPRVYFSPAYGGESCASNLVAEIVKAKKEIRVEAYQFTLQSVADALVAAQKRGVTVAMVVDNLAVEGRNSKVGFCASNGIPVVVDRKHGIFHNKMMVIDGKTVVTGSFNFTANAEYHNAENMWVLEGKDVAGACVSNWMVHSSHSMPLTAPRVK